MTWEAMVRRTNSMEYWAMLATAGLIMLILAPALNANWLGWGGIGNRSAAVMVASAHWPVPGGSIARVKKGMSVEEVRQVWRPRAEAKTKEITGKYYAQRHVYGGREGLGIYGKFQEHAAREKVRLAVRLLQQAGVDVMYTTIGKVTGQSRNAISNYWAPPRQPVESESAQTTSDEPPPPTYRFPGV